MPDNQASSPIVQVSHVFKNFGTKSHPVQVLKDVSVNFNRGEFTAVMGPSGAGKTTLMQCAAGLERVTSGSIQIGETILTNAPSKTIDRVRRRQAGFIFQQYNLLPMLTVAENVALPLRLRGDRVRKAEVAAAVSTVGLAGLGKRLPSQLSGGQQQRAAIARALLAKPDVIFADEPTGALDQATGKQVLGLLRSAVNDNGHTLVMVTHDSRIAAWADRVIFIVDGQIHSELWQPTAEQISVELARWEAP